MVRGHPRRPDFTPAAVSHVRLEQAYELCRDSGLYDEGLPSIAAIVAVVVELGGAIAIILGLWTRLVAVIVALYTVATGFIGHPYWTMTGADAYRKHDQLLQERLHDGRVLVVIRHRRWQIFDSETGADGALAKDAGSLNAAAQNRSMGKRQRRPQTINDHRSTSP